MSPRLGSSGSAYSGGARSRCPPPPARSRAASYPPRAGGSPAARTPSAGRRCEELLGERARVFGAARSLGALVGGGGYRVALRERAAEEGAAQGVAGAHQAQVLLRGGQRHAAGGLHFGAAHLHVVADADAAVGALEAVQPNQVQPVVLGVRGKGDGGGDLRPHDLDDLALLEAQRLEGALPQPRRPLGHVLALRPGHLQPHALSLLLSIRHPRAPRGAVVPRPLYGGRRAGASSNPPARGPVPARGTALASCLASRAKAQRRR
jgi:hypothetical protein